MGLGKKNVIFMKTIQMGFIAFWKRALHIYLYIFIYLIMDFFYSKFERKHDPFTQTENNFSTDL